MTQESPQEALTYFHSLQDTLLDMVAAEELFELGATVPDVMKKIGINRSDAEALCREVLTRAAETRLA
jgi:hypothetical protein